MITSYAIDGFVHTHVDLTKSIGQGTYAFTSAKHFLSFMDASAITSPDKPAALGTTIYAIASESASGPITIDKFSLEWYTESERITYSEYNGEADIKWEENYGRFLSGFDSKVRTI